MPLSFESPIEIKGSSGILHALSTEFFKTYQKKLIALHPLTIGGGNMEHKVVTTLIKSAIESGFETLRFNSRGAGDNESKSEGEFDEGKGELDDLENVVSSTLELDDSFSLAGFSMGSLVAANYAKQHPKRIESLLLLAPPAEPGRRGLDFPTSFEGDFPIFAIYSSSDEIVDSRLMETYLNGLKTTHPERVHIVRLEEVSHFFHGKLQELTSHLEAFWSQNTTSKKNDGGITISSPKKESDFGNLNINQSWDSNPPKN